MTACRSARVLLQVTLIVIVAAVASLLVSEHHESPRGTDGREYLALADSIEEGRGFTLSESEDNAPYIGRVPGYPAYLVAVRAVAGDSVTAVRISQFALLIVTAMLLYVFGVLHGMPRAGHVAALLCAAYLPFVGYATFHLSETLSTALTIGAMVLIERARRSGAAWWWAAGAGLAAGALVLTRTSFAVMMGLVAMALVIDRHRRAPRTGWIPRLLPGLAFSVGLALLVAPWAARNVSHTERPLFLGTGGMSLYISAEQYANRLTYKGLAQDISRLNQQLLPIVFRDERRVLAELDPDIPFSVRREIARDELLRDAARERFRELSIGQVLREVPERVAYLWSTGDVGLSSAMHRVAQVQFAAMLVLVGAGLFALGGAWLPRWTVWLPIGYVTLIHLAVQADPRYSVPARVFALLIAGAGAVWAFDKVDARRRAPLPSRA